MLNFRAVKVFLVALLWIISSVSYAAASEHVVIISVDGLRPDALSEERTPQIMSLYKNGIGAKEASTILPALTLPSHTSMLTGRAVASHGITWNKYRPQQGFVKVPTCFELARQQGRTTAMFVGKDKFYHLKRPGSLDHFSLSEKGKSKEVGRQFSLYLKRHGLPNLTFLHFHDADSAGHKSGWMSPAYLKAVKQVDREVGLVLEQLKEHADQTVVILTADHGGEGHGHGPDTPVNTRIPWVAKGLPLGEQTRVYDHKVMIYDTAATALDLLGIAVPENWEGRPVPLSE